MDKVHGGLCPRAARAFGGNWGLAEARGALDSLGERDMRQRLKAVKIRLSGLCSCYFLAACRPWECSASGEVDFCVWPQ